MFIKSNLINLIQLKYKITFLLLFLCELYKLDGGYWVLNCE